MNIWKPIVGVMLFTIISIALYEHKQDFINNHEYARGIVTKCDGGGRGNFGPGIYYSYYVDGKIQNGHRRCGELPYSIGEIITQKSFPLVYKKYWFGYEDAILIVPEDFANYNLPFPDSLKWILQYVEK